MNKEEIPKKIIIISGPSGVGEDTIITELSKIIPIERIITTTTRNPRKNESQGNPYYFISKEEFEKKLKNNEFLEWAKHYNDNYYGVDKEEVERVANSGKLGIWKVDYQGVENIKKLFPGIVAIMLSADEDEIQKRLEKRGGISEKELQERMQYTKKWLKKKDIYDYVVYNHDGKLKEAVEEVIKILKKEGFIVK